MIHVPPSKKSLVLTGTCLALGFLVFVRSPSTNFVFDEQEALLANPYLQGELPFFRAFSLDFWGRPPSETIGSYRPLPNLLWRGLAFTLRAHTPFYLHLLNIVGHALVASALGRLCLRLTASAAAAWMTALSFTCLALSTEAVCGVVGLADVLAALCAVLLLWGVLVPGLGGLGLAFLGGFLGLFAKETIVSVVPLVVLFACLFRARGRALRSVCEVSLALALAFVLAVSLRRLWFPVEAPLVQSAFMQVPGLGPFFERALAWFGQPSLPIDPINNPLAPLGFVERLPTTLEVYASGVGQLIVPLGLSGDYSFAQILPSGWTPQAWLGALLWCAGTGGGLTLLCRGYGPGSGAGPAFLRPLLGFSLLWVPWVQLPVSNAFVLLPTIRADRLWYLPALGFCLGLGALVGLCAERPVGRTRLRGVSGLAALFLGYQALAGRVHACDYASDLSFWRATVRAAPLSAKARLNLGVMVGARGQADERIRLTRRAVELAPEWPMAQVYLGDALCRRGRHGEAWPSYDKGLDLGPNQKGLIALALQCLWDHGEFERRVARLVELSERHPGSWLAYLVQEIRDKGHENGGLSPEHRPRAYNQRVNRSGTEK